MPGDGKCWFRKRDQEAPYWRPNQTPGNQFQFQQKAWPGLVKRKLAQAKPKAQPCHPSVWSVFSQWGSCGHVRWRICSRWLVFDWMVKWLGYLKAQLSFLTFSPRLKVPERSDDECCARFDRFPWSIGAVLVCLCYARVDLRSVVLLSSVENQ